MTADGPDRIAWAGRLADVTTATRRRRRALIAERGTAVADRAAEIDDELLDCAPLVQRATLAALDVQPARWTRPDVREALVRSMLADVAPAEVLASVAFHRRELDAADLALLIGGSLAAPRGEA